MCHQGLFMKGLINPSGAEVIIFWKNYVNAIDGDALVPRFVKSFEAMVMIVENWYEHSFL